METKPAFSQPFLELKAPLWYHKPFHLFLAGGITNCLDWQSFAAQSLESLNFSRVPLVVFNPRRDDFDVTKKEESERQIKWEHEMLEKADGHLFWFPKDTLCPITLFELGKVAPQGKPLFVGCEPGYMRADDVKIQLSLIRPEVCVTDLLSSLAPLVSWHLISLE